MEETGKTSKKFKFTYPKVGVFSWSMRLCLMNKRWINFHTNSICLPIPYSIMWELMIYTIRAANDINYLKGYTDLYRYNYSNYLFTPSCATVCVHKYWRVRCETQVMFFCLKQARMREKRRHSASNLKYCTTFHISWILVFCRYTVNVIKKMMLHFALRWYISIIIIMYE